MGSLHQLDVGAIKKAVLRVVPPVAAPAPQTFKLVDQGTGRRIALPYVAKMWDGRQITVTSFKPSKYAGNPGYIYTDQNEIFVPSVVRAAIVQVSP